MLFLTAWFSQPGKGEEVLIFYTDIYTMYYPLKLDHYLNNKACTE